jgi:hypothetical protein
MGRLAVTAIAAVAWLAVVATCVSCVGAQAQLSYGQLAAQSVIPLYNNFSGMLPTLTNTTQPGNVNVLRKSALNVRDMLDLFVYAYPTPAFANQTDLWIAIRSSFNDGYTLLGDFQDLNHSSINYTTAEYEKRLDRCLDWQAKWQDLVSQQHADVYLLSPNATNVFFRNATDLSFLFWADVPFPPNATAYTGLEVVSYLTKANLVEAREKYLAIYNLTEVYTNKKHTEFHAYRKLLRTINSLASLFPIFVNSSATQQYLNLTVMAYNLFGDTNDNATAYIFYAAHGTYLEQQYSMLDTVISWANTRLWLLQVDLVASMHYLEKLIVASPLPPLPPKLESGTRLHRQQRRWVTRGSA